MQHLTKTQLASMNQKQQLETFRAMANELMKEKKIRWSEACLEIKKRYPTEARAAFGAPPKVEA